MALALPPLWGALVLAVLLAAWLLRRQSRREALTAVPLVALAAVALLLAGVASTLGPPEPRAWVRATTPRYAALWRDIAGHAADGVRAAGQPPTDVAGRLGVHRQFADLLVVAEPDVTLLLVDPDGQPVVWEGRGLLHEPAPQEVPREGYAYRAGFGAASLLAVAPLSGDARPWRVVAGRSFETTRLPFEPPGRLPPEAFRWSLVDRPQEAAPRAWLLAAPQAPSMAVEPVGGVPPVGVRWAPVVAGAALTLCLLALAAMRAVALAVLWRTALPPAHGARSIAVLVVAAALAAGAAAGAPPWTLLALLTGLAVAAVGWRWARGGRSPIAAIVAGGVGAALLAVVAATVQRIAGIQPLADEGGGAAAAVLRAALLAAAAGALVLAAGDEVDSEPRATSPITPRGLAAFVQRLVSRPGARKVLAWVAPATPGGLAGLFAVLLLAAAAATHDHAAPALVLLAAGGGASALWTSRSAWRRRPAALVPLTLLATLLGATGWQIA
ncbi:MAG TPA: hypothetical protein VN923_02670, partial [Thermoanaerobaculia bacterium]|nr:hypothetical protein [Thermoanaerobaculia bacterium]